MEIRLLNINPEVAAHVADPRAFQQVHGASLGDMAEEIKGAVDMNDSFRARHGAPPQWGGYLAIDPALKKVVGVCAFKGSPIDGVVEIAYFTLPPFEKRGYGTEMTAALVRIAGASPAVTKVIAHTLPVENASTALLKKNGFEFEREAHDPEDGRVWRFVLVL